MRILEVHTGRIEGVRKVEIDGRPQLVLDLVEDDGTSRTLPLTRDMARDLTRAFGRHPLVDEFFRGGKGLQ